MNKAETPIGMVWWEGRLNPDSIINLPQGGTVPFQLWMGRTNGDCLEWLDEKPIAEFIKHGDHNQLMHGNRSRGGIDRADMPQIPRRFREKFLDELSAEGVSHTDVDVDPRSLRRTQRGLNPDNVRSMYDAMKQPDFDDKGHRIIVSRDNKVLDGHHRWAAAAQIAQERPGFTIGVTRIDMPMSELLARAARFNEENSIESRSMEDVGPRSVTKHGTHNQRSHGRRGGYYTSPAEEAQSQLEADMDYIMGRTAFPSDYTGYRPGYTPMLAMPERRLSDRVDSARRRIRRWASEREQRRLSRLSPAEIEEIKAANRARVAAQRERQVRVVRPQLGGFAVPALAKAFDPLFEMLERVLGDVVEPELWIALIEDGSPVAEMSGPLGDLLDEMLLAVLVDDAVVKHLQGQHNQQTHGKGGAPEGWREGEKRYIDQMQPDGSFTTVEERTFGGPNQTVVTFAGTDISEERIQATLRDINALQSIAPVPDLRVTVSDGPFTQKGYPETVHGFVPMNTQKIFLRPKAVGGTEGHTMPVLGGDPERYALIHEYGHVLDRRSALKSSEDKSIVISAHQTGMSPYAYQNEPIEQGREAFAEAFVGWVGSQGRFASAGPEGKPFVRYYAEKYGWDSGGDGRAPSAGFAKRLDEEPGIVVADTFSDEGAYQSMPDERVDKHLQGQHDQQTHGKGGNGREGSGFQFQSEMQNWVKGRESERFGSESGEQYVKLLKASVASRIEQRLSDVSTTDLIAAAYPNSESTTFDQEIPRRNAAHALGNDPNMIVRMTPDGKISVQLRSDTISPEEKGFVSAGSPEAEKMVRQAAVSSLVQQWAITANDADAMSLAIQDAARVEFGLRSAADWESGDQLALDVGALFQHQPVYRRFVREQYNETQDMFRDLGVSSVQVSRGMTVGRDQADEMFGVTGVDNNEPWSASSFVEMRPLSSWSGYQLVSEEFAQRAAFNDRDISVVFNGSVPVSQVFSTPFTGAGCFSEAEFVLLAGLTRVQVRTLPQVEMDNLEMDAMDISKHLSGQHDQKTHGKGGAAGRTIENRHDFKTMLADDYISARGGGPRGWSALQGDFAPSYKALVSERLAARMSDIPAEELVLAGQGRSFELLGGGTHLGQRLADTQNPEKLVAMDAEGQFHVESYDDFKHVEGTPNPAGGVWRRGGTPEAEAIARQMAVRELVNRWATTSNDADVIALSVQRATEAEFGITGSKVPSEYENVPTARQQRLNDSVDRHYAKHEKALRAFVRAQYDETQAMFARAGVTDIIVHRGRTEPESVAQSIPQGGTQVTARLRPMSSWSTERAVAERFAGQTVDPGRNGVIMTAKVPVKQVLSTPSTGNGCLGEYEVVILGPSIDANMTFFDQFAYEYYNE